MALDLFDPIELGPCLLKNRAVMPPMTRNRSPDALPNRMNVEYYVQRASAGLIVAESTAISPQGLGWINSPGIFSQAQTQGWRDVTDAVHDAGGRIFMQLWHAGRCSHVSVQPDGESPVAPSVVPSKARSNTPLGRVQHSPPRAFELTEIPGLLDQYRRAADNAMRAGCDGVELHAANGYLLDQFLRDGTNKRTDAYGGSAENRARIVWDAVRAASEVCGRERVGLRISPTNSHNDMSDSDPETLYATLVTGLNEIGPVYLHVVEGSTPVGAAQLPFDYRKLRSAFRGIYIANNGYTLERVRQALAEGHADMFSFGRMYVANPDLVERLRAGVPLNAVRQDGLHEGDARGYIDYPALAGVG